MISKIIPNSVNFLGAFSFAGGLFLLNLLWGGLPGQAVLPKTDATFPGLEILIVSAEDGPIVPDEILTLREAIALVNGTLVVADLSISEQQWVIPTPGSSVIEFNLPPDQTTIELTASLPAIAHPGLMIDGTSQPNGDLARSENVLIPSPRVAITPAPHIDIRHGLTLVANDITIRGLSLYGFSSVHGATETTPPGDIFITHQLRSSEHLQQQLPELDFSVHGDNNIPKGIIIEQNWLGLSPRGEFPTNPSAFGVVIFNSTGTTLQRNRIAYHEGSAIITGARAENLKILENEILFNGFAGMPDGLRLEGYIGNSMIQENLICGNSGSAIFMFKPEGAVEIQSNAIHYNGQRLNHAAIYVMGSDHRIVDNDISYQPGPGIVVTAFSQGGYTHSQRNLIQDNRFRNLAGLSIDLNTRYHNGVQNFQVGDGPNPQRDSDQRRRDTGNSAINAPQFISPTFYIINDEVLLQGRADPASEVQLYHSQGVLREYGPLNQPLATVTVDDLGLFSYRTSDVVVGDVISAIATDPRYGTSEPASNVLISNFEQTQIPVSPSDVTRVSPEQFVPDIQQCIDVPLRE